MMRILFRDTFWIHNSHNSMVEVVTTRSLAEARTYLQETTEHPHIIFLGLSLLTQNADGVSTREVAPTLEFIKELRHSEQYHQVPIIVYSRYNEEELKEQARDAGADHYLVKGELTPREIVDFVDHL